MNRRTLLATVGGTTLVGTAGCYGIAQMITGGDDSDESANGTGGSENGTGRPQATGQQTEGNETSADAMDEQGNDTAGESNESQQGNESGGNSRPTDATETIDVTDHGLDISNSPEPDVDKDITCYGTFQVGEYDLRKVRIDAVALAENGDRLDHGWVPFATASAGESYDVEIPFYVDPDEIAEYLIGATEATYAE